MAAVLAGHRPQHLQSPRPALKQAIISGELPPGISIDKNELCQRFGISRLPVTIAMNRLAYERLVLIQPQRGSFAARIELNDVVQWMTARRALEVEVVGECARRLSPDSLPPLKQNLLYQQAAIGGSDYAGFLELDVAFHELLTTGAGFNRIGEILDALRSHLDRVRRLLLPEPGRMESTLAEHRAIVSAICSGDVRHAEGAMRGASRNGSQTPRRLRTSPSGLLRKMSKGSQKTSCESSAGIQGIRSRDVSLRSALCGCR